MTESVSIDSHGVYNRRKHTLGTNLLAVSLASCLFLTKQGLALTRLLILDLAVLVPLNTLDYCAEYVVMMGCIYFASCLYAIF